MEKELTIQDGAETAKEATFEAVWASLLKGQQETQALRESQREFNQRMEEQSKDILNLERVIREQSKYNFWQKSPSELLMDALASPDMLRKFTQLGYNIGCLGFDRQFLKDGKAVVVADCYCMSPDYDIVIEIRTKLTVKDIDNQLALIDKIRQYMDAHGNHKKLVGAVACCTLEENAAEHAHNNGLYLIVLNGCTAFIVNTPKGFKAREW